MTNQEKKKWLNRYRELIDEAGTYKRKADELSELLFGVSAQVLSGMPRNPSPPRTDDRYVEHMEMVDAAKAKAEQADREGKAIEMAIDALPNEKHRRLLRYRYINGYSWYTIAELMDHCLRAVHDVHAQAIESLHKNAQ